MAADILLVEDEVNIGMLTKILLEREGHGVRLAPTIADGLREFRAKRPDLVLLDVMLPDGNGYSLCRTMKEEAGDAVPILFLTARMDVRSRVEGFKAGGLDYIQKPYSAEELVARVGIHIKTKVTMEEMKKKNYELEVRERLRRDMTDMIVHDLKAPVTSIQATLDIIKAQGLMSDAESEKLINLSQSTTGMMLIMINDLLDVARSEVESIRTNKAPVDVADLVEKVKNLFDPACGHRKLTFKTSVRAAEKTVFTDHQLLFRILCNLSVNALKFSPHGGEILLECSRQGSVLRLSVSDRGPGVPDALKRKIFEKGVSFGTDKDPNDRSTGIGLAFCALAAQALGGKIWVEDRQGGGSSFLIELPNVQLPAGQKIKA